MDKNILVTLIQINKHTYWTEHNISLVIKHQTLVLNVVLSIWNTKSGFGLRKWLPPKFILNFLVFFSQMAKDSVKFSYNFICVNF